MRSDVFVSQKILVVDDDLEVTDTLEYHLKSQGYEVKAINDPLLFMGTARNMLPDLIILDVAMPELSGLQLCRMIKLDTTMKRIPIIFLNAKGNAEDSVKGFEAGADD